MSLYILEGPDRCGKTTLARAIVNATKAIYIHASGEPALHAAMQAYHESLLRIAQEALKQGHTVVMDRLWPSEVIYGEIFRKNCIGHTQYDVAKIRGACLAAKATYIFCMTPDAVARHAQDRDHNHSYDDKAFAAVVTQYQYLTDLVISMGREKVVKYDLAVEGQDIPKFIAAL